MVAFVLRLYERNPFGDQDVAAAESEPQQQDQKGPRGGQYRQA